MFNVNARAAEIKALSVKGATNVEDGVLIKARITLALNADKADAEFNLEPAEVKAIDHLLKASKARAEEEGANTAKLAIKRAFGSGYFTLTDEAAERAVKFVGEPKLSVVAQVVDGALSFRFVVDAQLTDRQVADLATMTNNDGSEVVVSIGKVQLSLTDAA